MLIYLNCTDNINTTKVAYATPEVSVFSSDHFIIELPDSGSCFLWGEVYGVTLPNGTTNPVSLKTNSSGVLGEFFANSTVDQIIDRLEGNFVCLLIRGDKNISLFADRFNRHELFYIEQDQGVVVSSTISPLIKQLNTVKYSQNALVGIVALYGGYSPKKHTLYDAVRRLGVGERFVSVDDNLHVERTPALFLPMRKFGKREHGEYCDILQNSVAMRGSSSCNWIYMSSGWDSSSLLALLVDRYGPRRVRCVIGRMKYSQRSQVINQFELDRAEKLADYFGVKIDQVDFDLTGEDSVAYWEKIRGVLRDQHIYAHSAYNFFRLADYIAQHGGPDDAVFAGEISDGIHNFGFAQYATILEHQDVGFREYSDKMSSYLFGPTFLKSVLADEYKNDFVYQTLCNRMDRQHFDDVSELTEQQKKARFLSSFFHRKRRVPFADMELGGLLTATGCDDFEKEMSGIYLDPVAAQMSPENVYSCLLYLYNSYHWQGGTVRGMGVGLKDSTGLTLALPYWDSKLYDFLCEMPENWGRGLELRPTKYPLKWMLKNRVDYPLHLQTGPHSYLYDVNPQFNHTSEFLFGSALRPFFCDLLRKRPYEEILQPTHFDLQYIDLLVSKYLAGEEFHGTDMGNLLSLVNLCMVGWF